MELKKEAEFFGDIIVVPYLDSYDLVVLKTVAICEYGVSFYPTNMIPTSSMIHHGLKTLVLFWFAGSSVSCQIHNEV